MLQKFKAKDKENAKPKVGVIFGGVSSEHSISCISASAILEHIDREKFDVFAIGITKQGVWLRVSDNPEDWKQVGKIMPEVKLPVLKKWKLKKKLVSADLKFGGLGKKGETLDAVFPVLHGPYGEDGTVQGLLEVLGIPFVGCGVAASAIMQDKSLGKAVLRGFGVPVTEGLDIRVDDIDNFELTDKQLAQIREWSTNSKGFEWKVPVFVKPARAGSSVGVTKVQAKEDLMAAIRTAAEQDPKILIEKGVEGREIECAVFGARYAQTNPIASTLGEIVTDKSGFYDFEAKYISTTSAKTRVNPPMDAANKRKLKELAAMAYKAADCEGLARVDMFLTPKGEVFVNEINTMPGFTPISMYPQLMAADGVDFKTLVNNLIEEALSRPKLKLQEEKPQKGNGGSTRGRKPKVKKFEPTVQGGVLR